MNVLVAAPHPDDETLGCGGTLMKLRRQGASLHWLIFTAMTREGGYSSEAIRARDAEIARVEAEFAFAGVHRLGYATTRLDTIPMGDLVSAVASVVKGVKPEMMLVPFLGDAHSDHAAAFRSLSAC